MAHPNSRGTVAHPNRRGTVAHPNSRCSRQSRVKSLLKILPKAGFEWPKTQTGVLDLSTIYRQEIVLALYEGHVKVDKHIFDKEMAAVILEAVYMDYMDSNIDSDRDITETDPIVFWAGVKHSLKGTGSFVESHLLTAKALHAFVALAIEARELNSTTNQPNQEGGMVRAIDALINIFAEEGHGASTWSSYFERPEAARAQGKGEAETEEEAEESRPDVQSENQFKSSEFVSEEDLTEDEGEQVEPMERGENPNALLLEQGMKALDLGS